LTGTLFFLCSGISQNVSISGVVNHYLQVTAVLTDRVQVTAASELSSFHAGDKVMLIQMTGGMVYRGADFLTKNLRARESFYNAGRFEILQVERIITGPSNYVVFTDDVFNSYDAGEKIQLVRFVEGDKVTVTGEVSPKPWDGTIGGIVAILGMDTVELKSNINASYTGFKGGTVPSENYTGGCRQDVSSIKFDTLYFLSSQPGRSGNKGEGIISVTWPYTKGTAFALNGGGAGNGLFSGGAGGGNFRAGGDGGQQSASCGVTLKPSWGGYGCYDLYTQANRQIIMGGGGGTGVKSAAYTATNGGNGGGIVFILTGTLVGGGKSILANGQSVSTAATGSGGGGGAGGSVLLDVTSYSGTLQVGIRGGTGGSTNGPVCTGTGGGGSGGILWYSGANITGATVDTAGGFPGTPAGCMTYWGNGGFDGSKRKSLLSPLTGFLFNSIHGTDTICAGQVPGQLTGSQPKGGIGVYTYQWEQSTDKVNWVNATGTATLRTLQPPALNQSLWYRRVVFSDIVSDTSRALQVYVYPAVTNNTVSGTDTICYNLPARQLTGTGPAGGNGTYKYQWQYSADQSAWTNGETTATYLPGALQQTRWFRRIVTSTAYCANTSNSVKVTVLPSVSGNDFPVADTMICESQVPHPLSLSAASGGDGAYSYLWQTRGTKTGWTSLPSSNVSRYSPSARTDTTLYRRIVYSGNDKACKDTSGAKTIAVLPHLTNNLLTSERTRYCYGETPLTVSGTVPSGGNGAYAYSWQQKDGSLWSAVPGATARDYSPSEAAVSDLRYRRILASGSQHTCRDTSLAFSLVVVPPIQNTLGLQGQIKCEGIAPAVLNPAPASGGLGGFSYRWIAKAEGASAWTTATGLSNQVTYAPGVLEKTTLFARIAGSDVCADTSEAVTITVYPAISHNLVSGGAVQYTCYNTAKTLQGSQPAGGNGSYDYQWQKATVQGSWTAAEYSTTLAFTGDALTDSVYYRRIVYSSPALHECSDTSGMVLIRINTLPSGSVFPVSDTLCAGAPLMVRFAVSGDHPPFRITMAGTSKEGVMPGTDSIEIIVNQTAVFGLQTVTDDSGCVADPLTLTGSASAFAYPVPVAHAGADQQVCGNTGTLQAVKSIPGSSGWWNAPEAQLSDETDPATDVTANRYGTLKFTWKEQNWQCADTDTVLVTFFEVPQAPEAGADQELDFTFATQLQAAAPAAGTGTWTVVEGNALFSNDTLPDAAVTDLGQENTLRWTIRNGVCPEVHDDMNISVKALSIPKGFTPNGDNNHDYFDLGALHAREIALQVFNSTGVLVYESDDYLNDEAWKGRNRNGVELPEGTYYYIAKIKVDGLDRVFTFKSFVEILR
jgi:gliding motility-associated-like protein